MHRSKAALFLGAMGAVLLATMPAAADCTLYTTEAAFLDALDGGTTRETFDGFDSGTEINDQIPGLFIDAPGESSAAVVIASEDAVSQPNVLSGGVPGPSGIFLPQALQLDFDPSIGAIAFYLTNLDPRTSVGLHTSLGTWLLGYPDRAVHENEVNEARARQRAHPFNLGCTLLIGGLLWDYRCEPEQILARVEEGERLGQTHNLPFISDVLAQVMKGVAWLRAGHLAKGIPQLRSAMETRNAYGGELWTPYWQAVLAEGLALSGDLAGGLRLIEASLTQIVAWLGGALVSYRNPAAQRLDTYAPRRPCRCGAKLLGLARLGTRATSQVLGIAHRNQPRAPMAAAGQAKRGSRGVIRDLLLVHRGL